MVRVQRLSGALLAVLMIQPIAGIAAGERTELKAAFRAGKLELTLTAKDEGATLELKIKNQTKEKLLLVIPQGKTEFDIHGSKVALVASALKNVDLLPEGTVTLTFPMEQSGRGRWTSGSVTQSVTPPTQAKQ